jgi:hypothetical protein
MAAQELHRITSGFVAASSVTGAPQSAHVSM